ncbi:zinc ribbon domain-containing protein [Paenibacillus sp. MZ03-122A]|uniref:zinc ribbon domain-containing protein n=1 Tax=Paenibacillus sp. MZ03-122A TaxID=2962033 RepID=UPI0020B65BA8|nr:zinc ribbon domain-containing protein [Paenibacillus sp. MZ03-122A]MCP3778841.1 zinc-ribbon domain-containing protein [Paenibacillus sp. MZ03-122A]
MRCDKCGKEIPKESVFCNYCGKEITINIAQQEETSEIRNDGSIPKKISYRKKIIISIAPFLILCLIIVGYLIAAPYISYIQAKSLMNNGEFDKASQAFTNLDGYKDSDELINETKYLKAQHLLKTKEYEKAIEMFINLVNYKDSVKLKTESTYLLAKQNFSQDNYASAIELLEQIQEYKDSSDLLQEANYQEGLKQFNAYNFQQAIKLFTAHSDYQDSEKYLAQAFLLDHFQGIWRDDDGYRKLTFKNGVVTKVLFYGLKDESTYTWSTALVGKEMHDDNGTVYYLKNDKLIEKDKDPYFGSKSYTKIGNYDDIPPEKLAPQIGMTEQEVMDSKWGLPTHVNKTTTAYGISEQWVYDNYKYIYFENGIVTTIQD